MFLPVSILAALFTDPKITNLDHFAKGPIFRKSVIKVVKWLRLSPEKTFWGQLDTAGSEFHIETGRTRRFPTFSGANRPRICSKSAHIRSNPF